MSRSIQCTYVVMKKMYPEKIRVRSNFGPNQYCTPWTSWTSNVADVTLLYDDDDDDGGGTLLLLMFKNIFIYVTFIPKKKKRCWTTYRDITSATTCEGYFLLTFFSLRRARNLTIACHFALRPGGRRKWMVLCFTCVYEILKNINHMLLTYLCQ